MTIIALDHDSTLAATNVVAAKLIGEDYGYEDIESWEWGLEEFGYAKFLNGLWHAWTLRPLEVPTTEPGLDITVAELRERAQVDIVSSFPNHLGIREGKLEWLEAEGIEYDNFIRADPSVSKAELDYDYYIDDKPALPEAVNEHNPEATVLLYDQRYNRDAEGEYIRVHSVADAANHIIAQEEVVA